LLLQEFLLLLGKVRDVFSQERVFVRVCRQALGSLCALGSRTIARVLAATGRDQSDWSTEYRVFSRSPWKQRELFFPVLEEALRFCPGKGFIPLAGDFTHLQKSGKQIAGVHCMRDPLSPAFHTNLIYGLRFFQVTLLCPFQKQTPPLPARSVPVRFDASPVISKPGKRASELEWAQYRQSIKARPSSKAARQAIEELREDFDRAGATSRNLLLLMDGSFCNQVFFAQAMERVELVCRCRKDAVLCVRTQQEGANRFYAKETFTPQSVREDEKIECKEGTFFHGGSFHTIRYKELKNVYWRKGAGRRPLRLIVIAPTGYRLHHKGKLLYRQPAYLLTTDLETAVEELIAAYLERWQIEVNHREEKSTLGVGDAQVRNEHSVPRQPAFVVAVYALLLLAALRAYGPERTGDYLPPPKWGRPSKRPSCLDIVALLRQQIEAYPEKLKAFETTTSALNLVLKAAA
jgi:hypothetical protein